MSLLDKLHDKVLNTEKKHIKYPLLLASGIAHWFAGTYEEIKGHGEAAKAGGEKMDYKLYEDGLSAAAAGEVGAYAAAVHSKNLAVALPIAADLLVRNANALISFQRSTKRLKEDLDSGVGIDWDLTGAVGAARTLAYKLANRRRGPDAEAEPMDDDGAGVTPLIFPDPLPEPPKEDEMRIMGPKPGLEEEISDSAVEEPGDDVLQFEPAPALAEELPPGPFEPKP